MTVFNSVVLYGTFINPVFDPVISSFLCNPVFLLPSLVLNYRMLSRYHVFLYGGRAHVKNMFMLPSGKSVIVETRDGEWKEVQNIHFYGKKLIENKFERRLDFGHGANNYLYLRGNPTVFDQEVLNAVLAENFIDTQNVAFNINDAASDKFTWDYKELVKIKQRKRIVSRFYRPNPRVLLALKSKRAWERAKALGMTVNYKQELRSYFINSCHSESAEKKNRRRRERGRSVVRLQPN